MPFQLLAISMKLRFIFYFIDYYFKATFQDKNTLDFAL